MEAGQGFHDPALGYGDIAKISSNLLQLDHASFMLKLAQVLEMSCTSYTSEEQQMTHDLPVLVDAIRLPETVTNKFLGQDINVAVVDYDFPAQHSGTSAGIELGQSQKTNFVERTKKMLKSTAHGITCIKLLYDICCDANIYSVDYDPQKPENFPFCFSDIVNFHNADIDIVSCSISQKVIGGPELAKEVNNAVVNGKIIVCSAGNKGHSACNTIGYPA